MANGIFLNFSKCFLLLLFLIISQELSSRSRYQTLPRGIPIPLETLEELDTRKNRAYQKVNLRCLRDVYLNNQLLIARGAPAWALIAEVKRPGFFGKQAAFKIELRSVKAVDGTDIYLSGDLKDKKWKDNLKYSLAMGGKLFYHFGSPFWISGVGIRGFEKKIPAGFRFFGFSTRSYRVRAIAPLRAFRSEAGAKSFILAERAFLPGISGQLRKRAELDLMVSIHSVLPDLWNKTLTVIVPGEKKKAGSTSVRSVINKTDARLRSALTFLKKEFPTLNFISRRGPILKVKGRGQAALEIRIQKRGESEGQANLIPPL